MKRVVVTGFGILSPIGNNEESICKSFENNASGISYIIEWDNIPALRTKIAGAVKDANFENIPRKFSRSMGRIAMLSVQSVNDAIKMSNLEKEYINSEQTGLAYGSTMGSLDTLYNFYSDVIKNGLYGFKSTSFLKIMSHTCAANIAQMFGIKGRIIAPCTACASSSQAIGFGYESIKYGREKVMICGGAEELHFTSDGVFESMYSTSTNYNNNPEMSPRPFDKDRDGLVVSEGAATVILEDLEFAKARGANILAEIIGFSTNCDGEHLTSPSVSQMKNCMIDCIKVSGIETKEIDYINAHATGTEIGDIAESKAIDEIFGHNIKISSTKGYTGHMLGGCGAAEFIFSILSIKYAFLPANKNLKVVDQRCSPLDYLMENMYKKVNTIMTNNFAFGGINTSLIIRKYDE
jgi:3-oxoacyl-[acyl-carrier-protein] synthase II